MGAEAATPLADVLAAAVPVAAGAGLLAGALEALADEALVVPFSSALGADAAAMEVPVVALPAVVAVAWRPQSASACGLTALLPGLAWPFAVATADDVVVVVRTGAPLLTVPLAAAVLPLPPPPPPAAVAIRGGVGVPLTGVSQPFTITPALVVVVVTVVAPPPPPPVPAAAVPSGGCALFLDSPLSSPSSPPSTLLASFRRCRHQQGRLRSDSQRRVHGPLS